MPAGWKYSAGMSLFTREELLAQAAEYKKALTAVAHSKSYSMGNRTLTRQDLSEIRKQLRWIEDELRSLEGKRGPVIAPVRF